MSKKKIEVAVYVHKDIRKRIGYDITAYTYWYNPNWTGYNQVFVIAENGTEAKRKAIQWMKAMLKSGASGVNIGKQRG